ncbi:MAG: hypothetical protein ACK4EX_06700 [Thermaurantimonas sp.]|uniref:hypothetical protein n=1 Tax=Thermaurantimonas sp. TaxID=2681568 RepID=UPI0039187CD5
MKKIALFFAIAALPLMMMATEPEKKSEKEGCKTEKAEKKSCSSEKSEAKGCCSSKKPS